jgi:small subunit ribosomal protein S6
MPTATYECLFLLDSTKTAGNIDGARGQLHTILEKFGAEILASRPWDDRRLAYPIKGHKKGLYYLVFFKADSLKMSEMDHDFRFCELILRHLVSHIDPKWETEMLEVARDDHRHAYQAMREESPDGGADGIPSIEGFDDGMDGDKPRRRPRAEADKV